jgi:acyl carrier protein
MSKPIPQGIEVLVLKAAVDPDFKQLLLQRRIAAAEAIGLELTAPEATMLAAVPAAQLEAIISRTSVPQEHRRAFLGQAAAAMLAALSPAVAMPALAAQGSGRGGGLGALPPDPAAPPKDEKTVEERVIEILAERTGVDAKRIKRDDTLVKDLGAKPEVVAEIRKEIAKKFDIKIPDDGPEKITVVGGVPIAHPLPDDDFKKIATVGETIDYVEKALKRKAAAAQQAPAAVPIRPAMFAVMRKPN